ncbi:MAG: thermonuclease family protein, partial [Limnospira sp.]
MKISDRQFRFVAIGIWVLLWGIVGVGCSPAPEMPRGETVRVERVVSGQTLEIVDRGADIPVLRRVRLIGISAPDLRQDPWGSQAQQKLEELCQGRQVLLEWDEKKEDR